MPVAMPVAMVRGEGAESEETPETMAAIKPVKRGVALMAARPLRVPMKSAECCCGWFSETAAAEEPVAVAMRCRS